MIVLPDKPIVFFDVDDTLILWGRPVTEENQHLLVPGIYHPLFRHEKHIELMRQFKARGFTIVVWSQGGSEWAEQIVVALELQDLVDVVMPKPYWYVDDLEPYKWMTTDKHIYFHQKDN